MVGMPKDTRTRYQGVYARHQQRCRTEEGGRCNCKPSYYGIACDRARRKHVGTRRQPTTEAARNARADLQARLDRGEAPATRGVRLTEARERFVKAAREGRALNKHGRRYKRNAIDLIEGRLKHDGEPRLGRRARKAGLLSTNGLAKRARTQWDAAKLEPITLQECRHTAATWLDAASVSPKIASYLMGHTTPSRQEGAATITLARYTHTLPDDIERAREQLAAYLAQAAKEATG